MLQVMQFNNKSRCYSCCRLGGVAGAAALTVGLAAGVATTTAGADPIQIEAPDAPKEIIFETAWPGAITHWRPDRWFVDQTNRLAHGHVDITYYDGGTFSSSTDIFDDVQAGSIDMGSDWPSYWEGRNTAFSLITSVPMIFSPQDYMVWFWQYGGYELANEIYAQYNIKWWPHHIVPPEQGQLTTTPVRALEDYEGLRLRQCGRYQSRILEETGASAVFLPGGEVYAGLDRGVIDGAEFALPEIDWNMGLHEIADYVVRPGWHQPGPVGGLMMNRDAYEDLSDFAKYVFQNAAMSTMAWSYTFFEQTSGEYQGKWQEEGVEISQLEQDALDQILAITEEMLLDDARENPDHATLAVSQYDMLMRMRDWRESQQPFVDGWVWDSMEDTYNEMVEIAQEHGVYEHAMEARDDAIARNKDQKHWVPGTEFTQNPIRD